LRLYRKFSYKGANFRISSDRYDTIIREIIIQRKILSDHIHRQPEFLTALEPVPIFNGVPEIVGRMYDASLKTGVGPMAAVAGVNAQIAAEAAVKSGAREAIVENGGDIFISSDSEVVIGLYAGKSALSGKLGFVVSDQEMPIAVCSSSAKMGHSLSFGNCDLATVSSDNAALADAAATLACNLVTSVDLINPVMGKVLQIPGIRGILIIKDDKIGMAGKLPDLIKHTDPRFPEKVTRDRLSS